VQPIVGGEAAQFVAQQPADPALQLGTATWYLLHSVKYCQGCGDCRCSVKKIQW
jgi:hypothetical protein